MRLLFSSMSGAGHFGPLAPFIRSFLRGGHEVLVAGQPGLEPAATATGARFWAVDEPARDEVGAVFAAVAGLDHLRGNELMVSEVFVRLNAGAALPRLHEAVERWRPDFVIRETAEVGVAVVAETHGIGHARVAIGLGATEEFFIGASASNVDGLRVANGLPPDPSGQRLRATPQLTLFPASLEDPSMPSTPGTVRFRDPSWEAFAGVEKPARPLVYLTFGTVTGAMPELVAVFAEALAAVADVDADVLVTVGRDLDPAVLGTQPPHVRVERWVDQVEVLGAATAVICHGGGGSTLGALAAGVPLVVVPLFAEDQHINARRVAEIGAGVVATPDTASIHAGLRSVLSGQSYQDTTSALAAEIAGHATTDDALATLGL